MLGCQPMTCDDLVIGLSPPVERAVGLSVERLTDELKKLTAVPVVPIEVVAPEGG